LAPIGYSLGSPASLVQIDDFSDSTVAAKIQRKQMSDTLIWITGATQGIGLGLARHAPYPGATIVNISRRKHPDYETVLCDMADPAAWDAVCRDFAARLADFRGKRAIFINNANVQAMGPIGVVEPQTYRDAILANCAAPLILAEAFVREAVKRPELESGLVLLSSDSAAIPLPGMAAYCASKVAAEHWAEVVRRERVADGKGPWVVAVRPGAVITPPVLVSAALDPKIYPGAARVKESLKTRVDIDEAGKRIWAELPPTPGISVISFGEHPTPERSFNATQVRMMKPAN
jgi:benzil reductase ((S)-benzoin forming)